MKSFFYLLSCMAQIYFSWGTYWCSRSEEGWRNEGRAKGSEKVFCNGINDNLPNYPTWKAGSYQVCSSDKNLGKWIIYWELALSLTLLYISRKINTPLSLCGKFLPKTPNILHVCFFPEYPSPPFLKTIFTKSSLQELIGNQ